MGERNPLIVIYADILFSLSRAAVLVKYTLSTLHVVFICATNLYLFSVTFVYWSGFYLYNALK
jgi:hypothetical protein